MKEDATQLKLLEENIDLSRLSFKDVTLIFSGYLREIIEEIFQCGNLDENFFFLVKDMLLLPGKFFDGKVSRDDFYQGRVEAWRLHDSEKNFFKKNILRAVICCLYEEYSESGEKYEVGDMIELYFSVLLDIDGKYCYQFRMFFEEKLQRN